MCDSFLCFAMNCCRCCSYCSTLTFLCKFMVPLRRCVPKNSFTASFVRSAAAVGRYFIRMNAAVEQDMSDMIYHRILRSNGTYIMHLVAVVLNVVTYRCISPVPDVVFGPYPLYLHHGWYSFRTNSFEGRDPCPGG